MEIRFIKPHRHQFWGYRQAGIYFITITTKDKIHYFGKVECGRMIYSKIGFKAKDLIEELPLKFHDVSVDIFQVMPNHVHLLLRIKRDRKQRFDPIKKSIQTNNHMSVPPIVLLKNIRQRGLSSLEKGSVPSVINHYKGKLTLWCKHHNHPEFGCHANYFDKIIWNSRQYEKAAEYIRNNPIAWGKKKD